MSAGHDIDWISFRQDPTNTGGTRFDTLVRLPEVESFETHDLPETWGEITNTSQIPNYFLSGNLKSVDVTSDGWMATYENKNFSIYLCRTLDSIELIEWHRDVEGLRVTFPVETEIDKTTSLLPNPSQSYDESLAQELLEYGVYFRSDWRYGSVGRRFWGGPVMTICLVIPFNRLTDFADLYEKWKWPSAGESRISVHGWLWMEEFGVNYRFGRCGKDLETAEGIRERLRGFIPTQEPFIEKRGDEDRAYTARQWGVIASLEVCQRNLLQLVKDLVDSELLVPDPDHVSEFFAVAAYRSHASFKNMINTMSKDDSRRLCFRKIAPSYMETVWFKEEERSLITHPEGRFSEALGAFKKFYKEQKDLPPGFGFRDREAATDQELEESDPDAPIDNSDEAAIRSGNEAHPDGYGFIVIGTGQ